MRWPLTPKMTNLMTMTTTNRNLFFVWPQNSHPSSMVVPAPFSRRPVVIGYGCHHDLPVVLVCEET